MQTLPPELIDATYMHAGFSRRRLSCENMPSHGEVRGFAEDLANGTGFSLIDESVESRVVLPSRLKAQIRFGDG